MSRTFSKAPAGNVAIIGGTGFEKLPPEIYAETIEVNTEYGSVPLLSLSNNYVEPNALYFLSRHGASHGLAPHQIDYRANIAALQAIGVKYIFATNAVGALDAEAEVGSFVLFTDFIDFTKNRLNTWFGATDWKHTDFSVPYSPRLREAMTLSAQRRDTEIGQNSTYVCVDGPRFESPAEIRMFAAWGGNVVGMTGIPELIFAKEAGMEYAALGIITNLGAGLSPLPVDHEAVSEMMKARITLVRELMLDAAGILFED